MTSIRVVAVHSVVWADTYIRLTMKTTAESVIWADDEICLIANNTVKSVTLADTDIYVS